MGQYDIIIDRMESMISLRIVGSDIITITYVLDVNKSIKAVNWELRTSILWNWAIPLLCIKN